MQRYGFTYGSEELRFQRALSGVNAVFHETAKHEFAFTKGLLGLFSVDNIPRRSVYHGAHGI